MCVRLTGFEIGRVMALEAYRVSKAELLSTERSLRRDFRYWTNLDATEKQAEALVRRIRTEEAGSIWGGKHDDIPHLFPGMEFLTGKFSMNSRGHVNLPLSARKLIEKTRLFNILRRACCALHCLVCNYLTSIHE